VNNKQALLRERFPELYRPLSEEEKEERRRILASALGSITDAEAEQMRANIRDAWDKEGWR
jgi:hypothetical protein